MNPKILLGLLCLIGFFAVGCIQSPPNPEPAVRVDPFNLQINPNAPVCPPGCCHCLDGRRPYPSNQLGSEVSSSDVSARQSPDVNQVAASEVKKNPDCIPCQPQPALRQPTKPAAQAPAKISNADQVKHGAFQCEICKRATIGAEWEDLWADDGTSLHCVCKSCFADASPLQKKAALNDFIGRSAPGLKNNPSVQAAIKSASQR